MFTRQLKLLFSINRVVCTRDSDFWKIFHLFICPFNFPFPPLLDIVAYDTYVIRSLLNIIRKMPDIRSFYTSVLSQAFSPCEDFLAAGTNFGNLNIFRYLYWNYSILQDFPSDILNYTHRISSLSRTSTDDEVAQNNKTEELSQPLKQFSVSSKPVQGMVTLKDTLIVGGRNCLLGFNWDQLKQSKGLGKDVKPAWTTNLQLPG